MAEHLHAVALASTPPAHEGGFIQLSGAASSGAGRPGGGRASTCLAYVPGLPAPRATAARGRPAAAGAAVQLPACQPGGGASQPAAASDDDS